MRRGSAVLASISVLVDLQAATVNLVKDYVLR